MSIRITMACGHELKVPDTYEGTPVCAMCRERRVARVTAPPPRFSGACRGPYAATTAVTPGVVNVASAGPLTLKEAT